MLTPHTRRGTLSPGIFCSSPCAFSLQSRPKRRRLPQEEPIKIGFWHGNDRPLLRPNGKMSLLAMKIWEEDRQCEGRPASGDPSSSSTMTIRAIPAPFPGILHEAARRGTRSTSPSVPYASTQIAPGDADHDPEEAALSQPVPAPGNQRRVQLRQILLDASRPGPNPKPFLHHRAFFKLALEQNPKPQSICARLLPMPSSAATLCEGGAGGELEDRPACASSMTRNYPPTTADFAPHRGGRSRRPIPDLFVILPPIRSTRWGMVKAHERGSGFKPKMWGGRHGRACRPTNVQDAAGGRCSMGIVEL